MTTLQEIALIAAITWLALVGVGIWTYVEEDFQNWKARKFGKV